MTESRVGRPPAMFFDKGIASYFKVEKYEDGSNAKVIRHRNRMFVNNSGLDMKSNRNKF